MKKARKTEKKVVSKKILKDKVKLKAKKKDDSFAIIEHLNTQIEVYPNTKFVVPLDKSIAKEQTVTFDKVLATNKKVGEPYLKNCKVLAKCLESDIKDKKLIIFKYKAKKNYRIKTGHRQHWTLLVVKKILQTESEEKKKNNEKKSNLIK